MRKLLTLMALLGNDVVKEANVVECNIGDNLYRIVSAEESIMEAWAFNHLRDRFSLNPFDGEVFGRRNDFYRDFVDSCRVGENARELNGCLVDGNLFVKYTEPKTQEQLLRVYSLGSMPFMEPVSFSLDVPEEDFIRDNAKLLEGYKRCLK
jgi:hypothetical protein